MLSTEKPSGLEKPDLTWGNSGEMARYTKIESRADYNAPLQYKYTLKSRVVVVTSVECTNNLLTSGIPHSAECL